MRISVNYLDVSRLYPNQVREVEQKIMHGKSGHKGDPFTAFDWFYDWGQLITGHTFKELVDGTANKAKAARDKLSPEDKLDDELKRCDIRVMARNGRSSWTSKSVCPTPPEEVVDVYCKSSTIKKKWQDKIAGINKPAKKINPITGGFVEL